jgi:hypothetical protein
MNSQRLKDLIPYLSHHFFLQIHNFEIKKNQSSKKIKYIGINSRKDVNDFYKLNYKPLKKEIKVDYRR